MEVGTALTVARGGIGVAGSALTLLQQVREAFAASPEALDQNLLRLAYLDVEHNLVVLGGIKTRGLGEHGDQLFGVAQVLKLDAIASLLLNWPHLEEPSPARGAFRADYERFAAELETYEAHTQLLAQARYIVARVEGLRSLEAVDPSVRKSLRLGVRMSNLTSAHRRLSVLLRSQEALAHLVASRQ